MSIRPSRKPVRLSHFDYATPAAYFVTVCVAPRHNVFWNDLAVGAATCRPREIPLNDVGRLVDDAINQIPLRYPHITVDNYCIMPDHIHMIITIHPDDNGRQIAAPTLSTVVGHFKRAVSIKLGHSVWQKSYIERVVRNQRSYDAVWEYIDNNPLKFDYADDPVCFDDFE